MYKAGELYNTILKNIDFNEIKNGIKNIVNFTIVYVLYMYSRVYIV